MNIKSEFISMSAWRELKLKKVEDRVYRDKNMNYYIEPLMAPGIGNGQLILVGKKKPIIEKIQKEEELNMNIVVIDFYADWCSPCKMQEPILEELKKKYGNKVNFKKVNVDDERDGRKLSEKYHIAAVPTLIIEKDEKVIKRYVGVTSLKVLEKDIKILL